MCTRSQATAVSPATPSVLVPLPEEESPRCPLLSSQPGGGTSGHPVPSRDVRCGRGQSSVCADKAVCTLRAGSARIRGAGPWGEGRRHHLQGPLGRAARQACLPRAVGRPGLSGGSTRSFRKPWPGGGVGVGPASWGRSVGTAWGVLDEGWPAPRWAYSPRLLCRLCRQV